MNRKFAVVGDRVFETTGVGAEMVPAGTLASGAAAPLLSLPNPDWLQQRVAAGTYLPDEGLVPLPLNPDANGGVFVAGGPAVINHSATPQARYRGERLLVTLQPIGASVANSRAFATPGVFVGTSVQGGSLGRISLGNYTSQAFGIRFAMRPAEPGVAIFIPVSLSIYPTGTDSFLVAIEVLGRYIQ